MPVISSAFEATIDTSALTLARYAQIIRYDENAFFGVNASTNRERACRKIWTKLERDMVARYLGEAQAMIESFLMYPIGQKWYELEQHAVAPQVFVEWAKIQNLGTKSVSVIASGVTLDHTTDPAVMDTTSTSVTDEDGIHFYLPGTDVEVYPNTLTLSGGNLSATFPRARLVLVDFQENPETGLEYGDTGPSGPFAQTVDIKRVYTDTSDVGMFVWPLGENCDECGEDTKPACGYIQRKSSGTITLRPSEDGTCLWYGATQMRVNYVSGALLDPNAEDAILHLAHALMPIPPCAGCDPISMLWKQDQNTPEALTSARIDCPFGVHDGAWRAWTYAQNNRHFRTPLL